MKYRAGIIVAALRSENKGCGMKEYRHEVFKSTLGHRLKSGDLTVINNSARPARGVYTWLSPTQSTKNQTVTKETLKRAAGLSWFQPMYFFLTTGDAWHCDNEDTLESRNGKHIYIVMQPHVAIAIL